MTEKKARHTVLGKAFEYACALSLMQAAAGQKVVLEETVQLTKAKGYYEHDLSEQERLKLDQAARAGVKILLRYEPQITHPLGNEPLIITLASDQRGQEGDVRDVLCLRVQNQWEIGVSCKHNHTAVKHPRLSADLDFGTKWFELPCSREYFESIAPVFERLKEVRKASGNKAKWNDIGGEEEKVKLYRTVLDAFIREVKRLDQETPGKVANRLVRYLIGTNDFYKLITHDAQRITEIQAFNIYGTLNRKAGDVKAISDIRKIKLPTKIRQIGYLEENGVMKNNIVAVYCDNGWEISMRIHNASSRVEPSFKFDVQLMTYPREISNQIEPWDN